MPCSDKYGGYAELGRHETEGTDYDVVTRPIAGSVVAIVAPHGGGIEFLTADLAKSIAGSDHNYYAFRGLKKTGNRALHITSHRYDEPRALELIAPCEKVLTVHGLEGKQKSLQIGGRDAVMRERVHAALREAGFDSKVVTVGEYGGMEKANICNRGKTGQGVQLEIDAGLRDALRQDNASYQRFVDTVRSAL